MWFPDTGRKNQRRSLSSYFELRRLAAYHDTKCPGLPGRTVSEQQSRGLCIGKLEASPPNPFSSYPGELAIRTTQERNRLVEDNMPLARHIIKNLWYSGLIRGFQCIYDAEQEAYFALINAVDGFDPNRDKESWSSYLSKCIRRHLSRHSREDGTVRVPGWALSRKSKLEKNAAYDAAVRVHHIGQIT